MRPDEPVSRIMTETVVVIDAQRAVSEALDCFSQYSIHHLPVVRGGRLAGMLSAAEIMRLESFVPPGATDRGRSLDDRFTIGQLMHSPVTRLKSNCSIADAARHLIETGVHAVPIVDDAERIVGIVTTTDIMSSLLRGPPRRGDLPASPPAGPRAREEAEGAVHYHRKPTPAEFETALRTAELLHVEARDPRYLGKTMLYLDQRRRCLEPVLELADRFLLTGQDEHTHALLLKAILACKRAEEHATGAARAPFPLE